MDSPKFAQFVVTETTYKTVSSHAISAYVFIPKTQFPAKSAATAADGTKIKPVRHPVVVRWHGGFLVTGSAIWPDWIQQWQLDYALLHNAILISPNYRLLPEAAGVDVLADLDDFWSWLENDFQVYLTSLSPHFEMGMDMNVNMTIEADLSRVLVTGDSAGGYTAIMSALTAPAGRINAVIAAYGMLDVSDAYFSSPGTKPIFGSPQVPASVLTSHLAAIADGTVPSTVSAFNPPARIAMAICMVQLGRWTEFLGTEEQGVWPFSVLESLEVERGLPRMFLYHGLQDTAVPVEGTVKFGQAVREKFGNEAVEIYIGPGDHGFDQGIELETQWLQQGLVKITSAWLHGGL